jgi:hypothetical protein
MDNVTKWKIIKVVILYAYKLLVQTAQTITESYFSE